jgi:peptide/nickel transport system permease protein
LLRLIPGDPAVIMLDNRATAENVARLRHQLGLDRPLSVQYLLFLRNVVTGQLGDSLVYRSAVLPIILGHLPVTLFLAV